MEDSSEIRRPREKAKRNPAKYLKSVWEVQLLEMVWKKQGWNHVRFGGER